MRGPMRRIAIAVATLALTAAALSGCGFGGGERTITAYFPDSAGLFVGNDVGILGVPVGKVARIRPDGNQVKVTLEIDDDQQRIPANAGAVIVARSVATDRYVELTPVYRGGPTMRSGAVIPLSRTRTPVEFDEVLASLSDFATKISGNQQSADAVKRIVDAGSQALAGKGTALHDMITSLAGATGDVSAQRQQLVDTLTSVDTLVKQVTANEQTERQFVSQVAQASSMLAGQRQEFQQTLTSLQAAVTDLARFSADNKDTIVGSLDQVSGLVTAVTAKRVQLAEVLRDLPLALQNLQRADRNGTLPARVDPVVLTPVSGLLQQVCQIAPLDLCDLIDGTDVLGNLQGLLGVLTGGKP